MRILHVISSVGKTQGGTSEVVPRLSEALVAAGNEVRLVTCEYGEFSDAAIRAVAAGVEIHECRRSGPLGELIRYSKEFDRRIVDDIDWAEVVHLHGLWQWPCWRAAKEARRQQKQYVVQPHGFLEPERLRISALKKMIIGRLIERGILARASRVISTAESESTGIVQYGVRTPISVVPIGIDVKSFDAVEKSPKLLKELGVSDGKKVLLYFSRISPIKGLDMLAEAWARLKEFHNLWHLVVVGPDDRGYTEVVRQKFASFNTGSYTIHGPMFGSDKFKLLKSADLFVLPTRSENFSIAVQESLAAGVPVVCTKGAPWGIVEEYGCGWWPDVSVEGIETSFRAAFMKDTGCLRDMGKRGKAMIEELFDWRNIAIAQQKIYKDIIASRE